MATTKPITLKLLVDTKTNKVLFAEASKDFVDFLFFLLSFPIATVIKLLCPKSMTGSMGNIYSSFANLNESFLQPNVPKAMVLDPKPSTSITNIQPLLGDHQDTVNVGSATSANVNPVALQYDSIGCPNCHTSIDVQIECPNCWHWVDPQDLVLTLNSSTAAPTDNNKACDGYVKGVVSYVISDDLSVTPMSTVSSFALIKELNVIKLSELQETEVNVGSEEGLELLKMSLRSSTVLTDVFLGTKKGEPRESDMNSGWF